MIRDFFSKQFVAFLITGGIAAIVNFVSRILYNYIVDYSTAIIIAYATGMITAFILVKIFVFKQTKQKTHHSAFFFTVVNVIAVIQTWVISMILVYYIFPNVGIITFSKEIAHAIGIIVPVFTSYIGHKYWSFR